MASKIRWTEEEKVEFRKIRKNYNAKINRLAAKLPPEQRQFLPEKISMDQIYSRKDFNRAKKMASMFTARGSEETVVYKKQEVPKFFKQQLQYTQKVENSKRAAKRKAFTPEKGTATQAKQAANAPFKMAKPKYEVEELIKRKESMEKRLFDADAVAKAQVYKDRYIESVKVELGALGNPIVDMIKDIPADKFVKSLEGEYELNIAFVSDITDSVIRAQAIYNKWYDFQMELKPDKYSEEDKQEKSDFFYGEYGIEDLMNPYYVED